MYKLKTMNYCTQDEKRMENTCVPCECDQVLHLQVSFCYMYHNMHRSPSNGIRIHVLQGFAAANCNVGVCDSGELLSVIKIKPDGMIKLECAGSTGHIPVALVTFS